jgi:hypothetical protein
MRYCLDRRHIIQQQCETQFHWCQNQIGCQLFKSDNGYCILFAHGNIKSNCRLCLCKCQSKHQVSNSMEGMADRRKSKSNYLFGAGVNGTVNGNLLEKIILHLENSFVFLRLKYKSQFFSSCYVYLRCFGGTYTKIGTIQRRLAWPLRKDDTQNREAFHIIGVRRT